jgi:hypothetical protein
MIIKIGQEPSERAFILIERASVAPYSLKYRAPEMADDCASGRASLRVAICSPRHDERRRDRDDPDGRVAPAPPDCARPIHCREHAKMWGSS